MSNELKSKFERVMVIDDNVMDLFIATHIITKNNFGGKIQEYQKAREALSYLRVNEENIGALPEFIFLDLNMPEMNGSEFMVEFDKLSAPLKEHCKVIILSASAKQEGTNKAFNKNVIAFQEKPLTDEFLENIMVMETRIA